MWYNEQLQARAEHQYIFPDGRVLNSDNRDTSPVDGWEWHDTPPAWYPEETAPEPEEGIAP
jgi:hypothetical protein